MSENIKLAVAEFQEGCAFERHYLGHESCFKKRHFKKAYKKQINGEELMPGEAEFFEADIYPQYDMDGSPFVPFWDEPDYEGPYDTAMMDSESQR